MHDLGETDFGLKPGIPVATIPPAEAGGNDNLNSRETTTDMTEENTTTETTESVNRAVDTANAAMLKQLRTENEHLKATIRLEKAHRQITDELSKNWARSPELLFAAVRDDIQFADDGALLNAAALIERLKTQHPEQFADQRTVSIDAGRGRAGSQGLTRSALAGMSAAEIAKLDWKDVKNALSK
jgi:hypothetical protein